MRYEEQDFVFLTADLRLRSAYCPVLVGDRVPMRDGGMGRVTAVQYERGAEGLPKSISFTAIPDELASEEWLADCYAGKYQSDDDFPPGALLAYAV